MQITTGDQIKRATLDGVSPDPVTVVGATDRAVSIKGIAYGARAAWFPRAAIVPTVAITGDLTGYHVAAWFPMSGSHLRAITG